MMNSLVDATMSNKFTVDKNRECVVFTVSAHVSADDEDDDDMTNVIYNPINLVIPFKTISLGKDEMIAVMTEVIEDNFAKMFFRSGVDKFKEVVLTKLRELDLSECEGLHIETPKSSTHH